MKTSSLKYAIKNGFRSLFRHPLVLIASISTMTLMLLIMSAFTLFAINTNHLMQVAGQQPPIEIEFVIPSDDAVVDELVDRLKQDPNVLDVVRYSPRENYDKFVTSMEKEGLFEFGEAEIQSTIPYTISLRLQDPSLGDEFLETYQQANGVKQILMERTIMQTLQSAMRIVSTVSLIVFIILGLIASFIISNMVRIAALSRSVEINIMKYVGATNGFIRVPFVIEGAVVGLISAVLSTAVSWLLYSRITGHLVEDGALRNAEFALLPTSQVLWVVILLTFAIGMTLGVTASALAVRRHARV